MQQQPLAFTLVKTIVSARDDGKALSPALATAWDLLKAELSPAHRVIASEVKWSPHHQEDLRFVIDGIRKQFEKDPELEGEFLAFLAEVEPFVENEEEASILPFVVGASGTPSVAPSTGDVTFAFEDLETSIEIQSADDPLEVSDEVVETTEDQEINEPEDSTLEPSEETLETDDAITEPEVDVTTSEASSEVIKPLEELKSPKDELISNPSVPISDNIVKSTSSSSANYWPVLAGALLLAAISFSIWTFYASAEEETITVENTIVSPSPIDTVIASSPPVEPSIEYAAPSVLRLSKIVDSLRLAGEYSAALAQQQALTSILEQEGSSPKETMQAYSELAILYSTQENYLQAIVEQRKSLEFAREAFAKTDPSLGRSHLKLAAFYTESGELHMARAHLQQARKIFGQAQELVSPTDLDQTDQIAEKILKAS